MTTRHLTLLGRRARRLLLDRVTAALARWQEAWCAGSGHAVDTALCDRDALPRLSALRWRSGTLPGALSLFVGVDPSESNAVLAALLGSSQSPPQDQPDRSEIETTLEASAIEDLLAVLLDDLCAGGKSLAAERGSCMPPEEVSDQYKGYVVVRYRLGGGEIFIVLSPAVTEHLLRSGSSARRGVRNDLVPVAGAVSAQCVTVEASVGTADLTLTELAALSVGDVITMTRRLEQPVSVSLADGTILCSGHLGVHQGRKAVQLTRVNSNEV